MKRLRERERERETCVFKSRDDISSTGVDLFSEVPAMRREHKLNFTFSNVLFLKIF